MPLLFLFFLILASCSSDLIYNEPKPALSAQAGFYRVPNDSILRNSDTLLLGGTVRFKAIIEPLPEDAKNYYWLINSQKNPYMSFPRTFDSKGVHTAEFYVIDNLNDTLKISSTVIVSGKPVCEENLNLSVFQGSPTFSWNCQDEDEDGKLTYNFKLIDSDKKLIKDTTLQNDTLQFGFALPENFEAHITASNIYGFKTELSKTWEEL